MKFYRGMGCDVCNNTGYKGRVGLFELMIITDKLRDMIMANASVDEMRDEASSNGMVTLARRRHDVHRPRRDDGGRSASRNDYRRVAGGSE